MSKNVAKNAKDHRNVRSFRMQEQKELMLKHRLKVLISHLNVIIIIYVKKIVVM